MAFLLPSVLYPVRLHTSITHRPILYVLLLTYNYLSCLGLFLLSLKLGTSNPSEAAYFFQRYPSYLVTLWLFFPMR